ncbi:FeoA family protein [Desulfofundulus thermocisternus]|uniref:FeoA family protein n=1 Tax=Desulfofundulus thermocisternus TaxID=42471 RepID=UPI00217E5F71|nr:FeoA domain-containing protein [Desulfofundulus thermocisternus]MCS5696780.1 FeoA domain-containing protein [Desulfofundulus thermocisternus]
MNESSSIKLLGELAQGTRGRVVRVNAQGSLRRRILTMGLVPGVEITVQGRAPLGDPIQQHWTPLSAYAFMAMCLIYIPCAATIGAIKRETNSWKWTAFAIGYSLVLGWLVAVIFYQGGRLLGLAEKLVPPRAFIPYHTVARMIKDQTREKNTPVVYAKRSWTHICQKFKMSQAMENVNP